MPALGFSGRQDSVERTNPWNLTVGVARRKVVFDARGMRAATGDGRVVGGEIWVLRNGLL